MSFPTIISSDVNSVRTAPTTLGRWKPPSSVLGRVLLSTLCYIVLGYSSMDRIRETLYDPSEGPWEKGRDQLYTRLSNILMLASLLLATAASFITTPPPEKSMFDYNQRGPYICIITSFGLVAGGIIVGSSTLLVLSRLQRKQMLDTFCADRFRIFGTLIMLAYPAITLVAASVLLAFGLLTAVWRAEDVGMQSAGVIVLALPCMMATIFAVVYGTKGKGLHTDTNTEGQDEASPV